MEHFTSTGSPKISATKINVQGLKLYVYAYTFERNIVFWKVQYSGSNTAPRSNEYHMQTFSCLNHYTDSISLKMIIPKFSNTKFSNNIYILSQVICLNMHLNIIKIATENEFLNSLTFPTFPNKNGKFPWSIKYVKILIS